MFFFSYFVLNMYKAILVQNYHALHKKQVLLTEAVGLSLLSRFSLFLQKLKSLLLLSPPPFSSAHEESSMLTRLRYNFQNLRLPPQSKHEFSREVRQNMEVQLRKRKKSVERKVDYYSKIHETGTPMLRQLLAYLIFLIFLVSLCIRVVS